MLTITYETETRAYENLQRAREMAEQSPHDELAAAFLSDVEHTIELQREQRAADPEEEIAAQVEAITEAINGGGVTYSLSRQRNLAGQDLVAVSPFPERSAIYEGTVTPAQVAQYIRDNRDLLRRPGYSLGGWVDSDSGRTYLDVTATLPRRAAIELGKACNQKAVFDLASMSEIPTGGTGEAKDLPDWSARVALVRRYSRAKY